MITLVEVELALEHLEAHGMVTDLVAPGLADEETRVLLIDALAAHRGRPPPRVTSAFTPGHGVVWAAFDPVPPDRGAEVEAIRFAIEEGAMAPVWTRTGA